MKDVVCRYCGHQIKQPNQLRTAVQRFSVQPFHKECFELKEEETLSIQEMWKPVNVFGWSVTSFVLFVLAILVWMTDILGQLGDVLGIFAVYPIGIRLYSFIGFERKVK